MATIIDGMLTSLTFPGAMRRLRLHVVAEPAPTVVDHRPQFETESLVVVSNVSSPTAPRLSRVRDRAPPSLSTI